MEFDVFQWNECQLYGIALGMCYSVMMPQLLVVDLVEVLDLIVEVERNYQSFNPYHNFRHAMDVTYMMYHMLLELNAVRFFVQLDLIVLLVAALCHDISHPGLNNLYQINSKTELAIRYQDISVLENHSASQTLSILARLELLRNLEDTDDAEYVRRSIKSLILSTDMVDHFTLLKDFATAVDEMLREATTLADRSPMDRFKRRFSNTATIFSRSSSSTAMPLSEMKEFKIILPLEERYRLTFMKVLLHAADISNPCRPWPICQKWTDLVMEEFYLQGDCEMRNQMAISPNMDRRKADPIQTTLRFSDFIVRPYFSGIANFFEEMRCYCDQQSANRVTWQEVEVEKKTKKHQQMALDVPNLGIRAESTDSLAAEDVEETNDGSKNVLSSLQRLSVRGRRMSFAAGVIVIPDEIQTAEMSKSSVFLGGKKILFEVVESLDELASSANSSQGDVHRSHLRFDQPAGGVNSGGSAFATLSRISMSNAVAGASPTGSSLSKTLDRRRSSSYAPRRASTFSNASSGNNNNVNSSSSNDNNNHHSNNVNAKLGMPSWAVRSTDGRDRLGFNPLSATANKDPSAPLRTPSSDFDSKTSMKQHGSMSMDSRSISLDSDGSASPGESFIRLAPSRRVSRNVNMVVEASEQEENEDPLLEEPKEEEDDDEKQEEEQRGQHDGKH